MKRLQSIFVCLVLVFAPLAVTAQESQLTEAQQKRLVDLVEAGKQAYDRGDFDGSLVQFRKAYEIYAHADIVYRIALCYERLGEDQQAVKHYRQFLQEEPDAPERARVERTIEVIEARIAKSQIRITTIPDGAAVYIDDVANGAAGYTPTELAVKPGNYKLIVQKDGFEPVRELVTVNPGQSVQVRYQLSAVASDSAEQKPKSKTNGAGAPSVKFLTLATIGVAAGITSVVFFGLHSDKSSQLEELDAMDRQDVPRARYEQIERQKTTNLVVAVSTASVSAFALIWAYGTWVSDRKAARRASGPTLDWNAGPVLGYGWSF